MMRFTCLLLLAYAGGGALSRSSGDSQVVFRSDVSLVRVDAQVVDGVNRAITDLRVDDFVLHEGGRLQPIRNFSSEDMPVDVLFLLDVSASMDRMCNASPIRPVGRSQCSAQATAWPSWSSIAPHVCA